MPAKLALETPFNPRQYMLSKDFELYYYSDTKLKHVDLHTHDYYEFYFFLEGNVVQTIGEKAYTLRPGDMIVVPPGTPHFTRILSENTPYRRFIFWLSTDYLTALTQRTQDYAFLPRFVESSGQYVFHLDYISLNSLQSRLYKILAEIRQERFASSSFVSLYISELLLYLARLVHDMNLPHPAREDQDLYMNVISYIEEHLDQDLSLDALSRQFYLNKYYIAHIFKEQTGISIHQYTIKKRLSESVEIMRGGADSTTAARLCGFKDYSSFFRAFKKEYGQSPRSYLQNQEGAPSGR